MMKKGLYAILVALTVFALVMTGCDTGGDDGNTTDNNAAAVSSIKFATSSVSGLIVTSATEWADVATLDASGVKSVVFAIPPAMVDTEQTITIGASSGATVRFATSYGIKPADFTSKSGEKVTLEDGSFVVVQVVSGNKSNTNYYIVSLEGESTSVSFTSITIAGGAEATRINGSYSATLSAITAWCPANVSNSKTTNAEIVFNFGDAFRGTAQIIKTAGTAPVPSDADFASATKYAYDSTSKPSITFTDEDKLYVKVLAQNGINVQYYAYQVLVGRDATLKDFIFIGAGTTEQRVDSLGTPQNTAASFPDSEVGKIQMSMTMPSAGFTVKGVANDSDATIKVSNTTSGFAVPGTTPYQFSDTDNVLYVEVTPQSSKASPKYYKIEVAVKRTVYIPYGTPTTINAGNVDAIWTGAGATNWLPIDRANVTEGSGWRDQPVTDRSHGRIKLMWDEDGIWVYAEVWEKVVSPAPGDHMKSSVELFVNEAYPTVTTGDVTSANNGNGGQFRLGANGEQTGSPTAPAVNAFKALGHYNAVKVPTGMGTYQGAMNQIDSGYKLLFQAPWLYTTTYPIVGDKEIAIELQINATGAEGTRVGVLNWNNINSNSYSSLKDYGGAVLTLPPGQTLWPYPPTITAQPAGQKLNVGETLNALTVTATIDSASNGTLGYQWYSAVDANDIGTLIPGAINVSYTPTISNTTEGELFYFVVVSNTSTSGKKLTRSSNRVKVEVVDPNKLNKTVELITTVPGYDSTKGGVAANSGNYNTLFSVTLPGDLSDYVRMEVAYKIAGGAGAIPVSPDKTDIYFAAFNSASTQVGSTQYNADGFLTGNADAATYTGVYFYLDAYGAADKGGKIDIKYKADTNGDGTQPGASKEVLVTSVKLIAGFALDLSKEATTGWASQGHGDRVPAGYNATNKKIVWNFPAIPASASGNNQGDGTTTWAETLRTGIAFTPAQILRASNSSITGVDVIAYGKLDNAGDGQWRIVLGRYTGSENWAYAVLSAFGSAADRLGNIENGQKWTYTFTSPPPQQPNGLTDTAFMVFYGNGKDKTAAQLTIDRVEVQFRY